MQSHNRWGIVLAGVWLQLFLGTVYAWSYFQKPLVSTYGWPHAKVGMVFSLAICFVGLAAAWGGTRLAKFGPRRMATVGGVLFGSGYLVAAAALHCHSLPLLYLGYGVIGGTGIGLAYVTPVATVAKWFPDRKGLATGMVIMGFGFGALLMSKVLAPTLCQWTGNNLVAVFTWLGLIFLVATLLGAAFLRNPPPDDAPPNVTPPIQPKTNAAGKSTPPADAKILSCRFVVMWLIFFCNIVAGVSIISFQSPIFEDLWRHFQPTLSVSTLAEYGGWLIAISAVFNGIGRMFWGTLSDRIGRLTTFRWMFASQILVFALLCITRNPWIFGALICYVLLCYGGGFGTMPAFVLDVFGQQRMAQAYGAILTAWSAAGVVGPQLIATLKDYYPDRAATYSFTIGIGFLAVGLLASLTLRCKSAQA